MVMVVGRRGSTSHPMDGRRIFHYLLFVFSVKKLDNNISPQHTTVNEGKKERIPYKEDMLEDIDSRMGYTFL